MHILSDYYRKQGKFDIKFGLVRSILLKETFSLNSATIILLKNGMAYRDDPKNDRYDEVYRFIE